MRILLKSVMFNDMLLKEEVSGTEALIFPIHGQLYLEIMIGYVGIWKMD